MITLLILKIFFLLLAVYFTFVCLARSFNELNVGFPTILLMDIGIVGFITVQFLI